MNEIKKPNSIIDPELSKLRNHTDADSSKINDLAVLCFSQFKHHYDDWAAFSNALRKFSELANTSEIIIASNDNDDIMGAVAYVPAQVKKADFFPEHTPIIRMLVVDPAYRGQGIGKALSLECLKRAKRDGCKTIALHTSHIMDVALPMYLAMGFQKHSEAPDIFGVKYNVYSKHIA